MFRQKTRLTLVQKIIGQMEIIHMFENNSFENFTPTVKQRDGSVVRRQRLITFVAHLSTTCSRGAFRVVMCPSCVVHRASSTISLNIFSSQTAGPIWTKVGRNVPSEVLFKNCSQNLIPSKTLVPWQQNGIFLSNSLKNSSPLKPLVRF